ncbi:hypothetical protein EJB05_32981, partial [Eragrostis curvula]
MLSPVDGARGQKWLTRLATLILLESVSFTSGAVDVINMLHHLTRKNSPHLLTGFSTMVWVLPNLSGILFLFFLIAVVSSTSSRDTLHLRSSLSVENHQSSILQSQDGTFSCGFYKIYTNAFIFSIWYANSAEHTIVWSANRDRPVHARRSALTLQKDGNMVLTDYDGTVVWRVDGDLTEVRFAQLLDTGNFVMKDNGGKILWQSFDSPTDTLLPTQRFTATTKLIASTQLHISGHYILSFGDMSILSLIYDDPDVSDIYWPDPDTPFFGNDRKRYNNTRLGVLDDLGQFVSSDFATQQALVASDAGPGIKRRLTLDADGNLRIYSLNSSDGTWSVSMVALTKPCKIHGLCGPNGICHYSPMPTCSCPPGYEMINPGNWSQGCSAVVNITCGAAQPMRLLRLPNTDFWGNDQQQLESVSFKACKDICMNDCTCKGFLYVQGIGLCFPKSLLFSGRSYPPGHDARTMYIKIPMSVDISNMSIPQSDVIHSTQHYIKCGHMSTRTIQLFPDVQKTGSGESKWFYFYGFVAAIFVIEILFATSAWLFVLRRELRPAQILEGYKVLSNHFRRYSYKELEWATGNFNNEIGRGGSGIVYKGILDDIAIAVKSLENVRQGKQEFQSELGIIGRVNHMNLARILGRILGFCSEGYHRMIVYEYIENGSLSNILFNNNILLEWKQRFNIAVGVAKGLAYLHHECLEWVIHCDVKPDNILLDRDFEPKIIDFGLAKLLKRRGSNQVASQVRGTVGYIAPEWISGLPITAKVDVYSYGVVLLELVSGIRASNMAMSVDVEMHMGLSKLVRILADKVNWREQTWISEFADFRLNGQLNFLQARTLIKLAVTCLEEDKNRRPTMETVVQMLLSIAEADSAIEQIMPNEVQVFE